MDKNKLKFTLLEQKILNFLFRNPTKVYRGRVLARELGVSATAISNSIKGLLEKDLVKVEKDVYLSIGLNRDNRDVFFMKRVANLRELNDSGLISLLSERFLGSTIVLFGSYSYGEDIEKSDIDIALIGSSKKDVELRKYEDQLERPIQLHFFKDFKEINKNLRENIVNGIVLKGAIKL